MLLKLMMMKSITPKGAFEAAISVVVAAKVVADSNTDT